MTSMRGRALRTGIWLTGNFNPARTPDPVRKFRALSALMVNDHVPLGHRLSKERTPGGTKYDRVFRSGCPKTGRVVCYLHGGGYVAGLFGLYRDLAPGFIRAAQGCEVIFPDYSLAPESVYPRQLQEALDVWEDLVERQGYLPENIVLAGDSAGANLALALMLKLRDSGKAMPRGGICISLWGDMTCTGKSYSENYGRDVMFGHPGKACTAQEWDSLRQSRIFSFVGDADRRDPYVSPVFGAYHGFPPMFFTAGSHEMLLSDTLTVAEKLRQAGSAVECDIQEGMFHIYVIHGRMTPEGMASYQRLLDFIGRLYHTK